MRWQLERPDRTSGANEDLKKDLAAWGLDEAAVEEWIDKITAANAPPDLWPDNAEYFLAFHDLSGSRPVGFGGAGAIPISEIRAYCDLFGVEDVEFFFRMIRAADKAFLRYVGDKTKVK